MKHGEFQWNGKLKWRPEPEQDMRVSKVSGISAVFLTNDQTPETLVYQCLDLWYMHATIDSNLASYLQVGKSLDTYRAVAKEFWAPWKNIDVAPKY